MAIEDLIGRDLLGSSRPFLSLVVSRAYDYRALLNQSYIIGEILLGGKREDKNFTETDREQ